MTHVDNNTESRKSKHLTYVEMKTIEAYKALGLSNRKIATLLGRSPQTINNAINTASVTQKSQQKQNGKIYIYYKTVYSADLHYDIYLQNRSNCGRRPKWIESDRFTEWAERKICFEKIFKIAGQRTDAVDKTLRTFIQSLKGLDSQIFKTITSDNGSEFANLSQLAEKTDVYFCHPFAFFERGTSENQHKIIRRFLPKHQSLKEVSERQVQRIQQWMNDYPRRILDYKTPH